MSKIKHLPIYDKNHNPVMSLLQIDETVTMSIIVSDVYGGDLGDATTLEKVSFFKIASDVITEEFQRLITGDDDDGR